MITIEKPADLREGDLMFGPIPGAGGVLVGLGQLFLAVAEPVVAFSDPREWFRYRHTGVVTKAQSPDTGPTFHFDPTTGEGFSPARLVQAEPGGAQEVDVDQELWNPKFLYVRPNYSFPSQAEKVASAARGFIDTPYDFVTYGAIPLYRRGVHTERIKQIISGTDSMMCSRLVDAALAAADWHLFNDNRLPGNVTPSELLQRTLQLPISAMSDIK